MAEQAPTTDPAPNQPTRQVYPRSGWLLILRETLLLLRWYHFIAVLVIYLVIALLFQAHNDLKSLLNIYRDISLLTDPITQHAFISIPVFIILGVFILSGYWANKDEEREHDWSYAHVRRMQFGRVRRDAQEEMRRSAQAEELEKRPHPTGFKLRQTITGHTGRVYSVAWSPDGHTLASGSSDNTVRIWDPQTAQSLQILAGHIDAIESVAWSPDGHTLASGSYDETIRLWDPQTAHMLHTCSNHNRAVWSVAWSPDGHTLASGSSNNTVRIWDPQTAHTLHTCLGHTGVVWSVAWSPDGHALASSSADKTIRLWDPQTAQSLRILTGHTKYRLSISLLRV